jgi:hypothetical protein
MPTCTGNCAAHTPVPGDAYIMRGGDTWGSANFTITWTVSGTQANPIYIGVDTNWFSGASWNRPIWNAQQQTLGNFFYGNASWWIVDNIELTGVFWTGTAATLAGTNGVTSCGKNTMFENSYEHGWSWTTPWANTNGPAPNAGGSSAMFEIGEGCDQGANGSVGVTMRYNILDGSDTADKTAGVITQGAPMAIPIAYGNYSTWGTWGALDGCGDNWHDNVALNIGIPVNHNVSGASFHQNGFKHLGACNQTNIFSYNNVVQNQVVWVNGSGMVKYWFNGACGNYTMWAFNDLISNVVAGNVTDFGNQRHSVCSNGTLYLFNSTFECGTDTANGGGCTYGNGQPAGGTMTLNTSNIHWIGSGGTSICIQLCPGGGFSINETAPLYQNVAQANAQGYSSTSTFAWQPSLSSGGTVGTGVNNAALCNTIAAIDSFAGASCRGDISYGVAYNSTTHTLSFPAKVVKNHPNGNWDKGAYQFSGGVITAPSPSLNCGGSTTSFSFGLIPVNTSAQSTCILSNNGNAALNVSFTPAPAAPFSLAGGGTCGTTLAAGSSCNVIPQFLPTAAQTYNGTLTETDTPNNVSASIALTGTGISPAAICIAPSPVAFGAQAQNVTSTAITVTLTNCGGSNLLLNSPWFTANTGAFPGDFALVAPTAPTWTIDHHTLKTCTATGGGAQTCTATVTAITAGHAVAVLSSVYNSNGSVSLSQPVHNSVTGDADTWSRCPTNVAVALFGTVSGIKFWNMNDCFWVASATGSGTAIADLWTFQTSAGADNDIDTEVVEFHPSSGNVAIDISNGTTNAGASCTTCVGPAMTLTGTSDIIFPWISNFNSTSAVNSPYSILDNDSSIVTAAFGDATNQSSATTPSWTQASTAPAVQSSIAFTASSLANACANGNTIAPNATCNFQLTTTPTASQGTNETAQFNVSANVSGNVQMTVTVAGTPQASTPVFSPLGGTYTSTQTPSITSSTSGSTIIYTTDGSTPTTTSGCTAGGTGTAISNGSTITVTYVAGTSVIVNAIACHSGDTNSSVATAVYTFQAAQTQVTTPTISLQSGSYVGGQTATLATSTSGATICYRQDGGTPTAATPGTCDASSSTLTNGSTIVIGTSGTLTVMGTKASFINSGVASATYSIFTGAPILSPGGGLFNPGMQIIVTVVSSTGGNICYTLDQSTPTGVNGACSNGTQISSGGTITVTPFAQVFAVATQSNYLTSGVSGATYTPYTPVPAVLFADLMENNLCPCVN